MSAVSQLVLRVETMLFRRNFAVVNGAVGVLRTPEYSSKFPTNVSMVRCVLKLFGFMSHTVLPYVNFFVANVTSFLVMKNTVLVIFIFLIP